VAPSTKKYKKQINTKNFNVTDTNKAKIGRDAHGNKMLNQYIYIKDIGLGAYGKVKLYMRACDNELFAVKTMKKKLLLKQRFGLRRGTALDDVVREIQIMKTLNHKNIVKLHEVINDPNADRLYLVIEYCEKGCIMNEEMETEPLPINKAMKYMVDIVNGLEYLHNQKIIHRDIKPQNLFVAGDDTVKIGDFSVAISINEESEEILKKTVGSPAFLSPELCAADTPRIPGPPIDIWSLGVTLYFFIFGRCPFIGDTQVEMFENIKNQEISFPHQIDGDLEDLFKKLLNKDPFARITIEDIKNHPWFLKCLSCTSH
jgi:serine/threonine protein kinase